MSLMFRAAPIAVGNQANGPLTSFVWGGVLARIALGLWIAASLAIKIPEGTALGGYYAPFYMTREIFGGSALLFTILGLGCCILDFMGWIEAFQITWKYTLGCKAETDAYRKSYRFASSLLCLRSASEF